MQPSFQKFRFAPYAALVLLGLGIVAAVRTAQPGPRFGARARLVDLIAREDQRTRALRAEADRLLARLDDLEARAAGGAERLARARSEIASLAAAAGTAAVQGPGIVVELRDSSLRESPTGDPNDLVIHEQDLQVVVNALWAAGAEAMAVNGERITSSSAVRCVGNTLLLHGNVYAPPYRIAAVGDPAALRAGLDRDPLVERFRLYAREFRLGFSAARADELRLAAFRGSVEMRSAGIA